jgi:cytochrome P450
MSASVEEGSSVVVNTLVRHIEEQDGSAKFNMLDWTGKATLNVIGRVIFSHDFEGGNSNDAQAILEGRRRGVSPIIRYVGFLTLMLLRRFPMLNDLPIPAIQAQATAKLAIQSGVAKEMIKRQRELSAPTDKSERKSKDLLSRLISAEASGEITSEELYEQISTFVVSGHETTTQSLAFAIWELARNPASQDRLREELAQFPQFPSFEDFQSRLPFLDAVLRETLRLYPGLPYMERIATKDDVIHLRNPVNLPDGQTLSSITVGAGQTVIIPIFAIHRLDQVWDKADCFVPERWMDGSLPKSDELCSGWSNTLAFSDGPRSCIGFRLAIYQFKVILTQLVTKFRFRDTGAQITLKISSSLQPWVTGQPEQGPQLPVYLDLLE